MPFIQRVVLPTRLANTAANPSVRLFCSPGKCNNNTCINKKQQAQQENQQLPDHGHNEPLSHDAVQAAREHKHIGDVSRTRTYVKDITVQKAYSIPANTTTAIVHVTSNIGTDDVDPTSCSGPKPHDETDHTQVHVNGFANSFSYATDNEEDVLPPLTDGAHIALSPTLRPMKKLKQHVDFYSAVPPPTRSTANTIQRLLPTSGATTPQSTRAVKITSGYEFESISNITLSNALRQLGSLVLLASDIFDELQSELLSIGERSRSVQRKIVAVEQRVLAYDPKTVTVPESDLLSFAQRKSHYESNKAVGKELFTSSSRPRSVRILYEDAGKKMPLPMTASSSAASSPHSATFLTDAGTINTADTGANSAAGSKELVCTSIFGEATRKMLTQIDAEIETRLPAVIEDMRKWTSTEALGNVTVTPDCMHHVDTSISTSVVLGDNGILTPALSPSVISADAVDAIYSINISSALDGSHMPSDIDKDVPLNHRLPSPEEQCKIIALRYPAEVISVDTSGKRFQRMCNARKSTTSCYTHITDTNNLNDEIQTISRRSRSRKARGKRRNTIAGIDQKEIQDAANGEATASSEKHPSGSSKKLGSSDGDGTETGNARRCDRAKKFGRSKSSDILKKESVALPYDKGKSSLTRLNSLKQWGRNRFKFMQRNDNVATDILNNGANIDSTAAEKSVSSSTATPSNIPTSKKTENRDVDIDADCIVHDLISRKSESRFSHERKPSYSSSEKSMSVSSSGRLRGRLHLATCGNVKLRDSSSLNRQRRNGILANGAGGKEEQPHSSSGNWSASSESGRASIGSEITIQPKSSASNTSLNVSSFHPSSGPPSSMLSRRRFMNTSASSSVTSEGTATPDLQVADVAYPNNLDDETSSAYSCDTEGYYTSFHMDSGLRTLKEEELSTGNGLNMHISSFSFGGQSNQTVMSAENEYELFGRGSTSTTTSSAGTVCTTLLVGGGPDVPERISSLGKLNRSDNSNNASTSTLERSYSSSTIGSTLERTGTIKRNINAVSQKESNDPDEDKKQSDATLNTTETADDEFDFEIPFHKRPAQPIPIHDSVISTELDYSESSDLEGVERIERIKQKTTINAKRIPSMCIITPSTSDDENQAKDNAYNVSKEITGESCKSSIVSAKKQTIDDTHTSSRFGDRVDQKEGLRKDHNLNEVNRNSNYGFNNMYEKLKVVLPNMKSSTCKSSAVTAVVNDDALYDTAGEYVTIADISNNNNRLNGLQVSNASGRGIYFSNDIVRRQNIAKANDSANTAEYAVVKEETQYVSLNELPYNLRKIGPCSGLSNDLSPPHMKTVVSNKSDVDSPTSFYCSVGDESEMNHCADSMQRSEKKSTPSNTVIVPMYAEISETQENLLSSATTQNKGARVRVNAQGKIIYDSDSLKRRKGGHTTFSPGPYVKENESALPQCSNLLKINKDSCEENPISTAAASESSVTKVSESVLEVKVKKENLVPNTRGAKLLLQNGGISVGRKIANVRPIVAKSPLSQIQRCTSNYQPEKKNIEEMSITTTGPYHGQNSPTYYYQEKKHLLTDREKPVYIQNSSVNEVPLMPSPSAKSTSSTGSTVSSNTSGSSLTSNSSKDQGYKRFYKYDDEQQTKNGSKTFSAFPRNGPIYWTLQNRKKQKTPVSTVLCRDDLYATPIRKSERIANALQTSAISNISLISPRHCSDFKTSTPQDSQTIKPSNENDKPLARNFSKNDNSPERLNTCSDRIGQSKTSLMDFKKLLLAKSAKTSPIPRKVSAVELLKKNGTPSNAAPTSNGKTNLEPAQSMDSSMKLLDLSGSPKTFASRRMLRQGQFGSPSKSFAPKLKSTKGVSIWRNNTPVPHTEIMSTTIVEDNIEDDHTPHSNGIQKRNATPNVSATNMSYNIKNNFFIQTEAKNSKTSEAFDKCNKFERQKTQHTEGNMYVSKNGDVFSASSRQSDIVIIPSTGTVGLSVPALETAL